MPSQRLSGTLRRSRRTAISDRGHLPPDIFVWPSQSSASQSYSSQLIYLWRFRDNSMTAHLIEDWTPPLAHHVGDWKTLLPWAILFADQQDRLCAASPLFDATPSAARQLRRRFVSNAPCQKACLQRRPATPSACCHAAPSSCRK